MDVMPMVSQKQMGVYIEREADTTMTKLLLDVCDVRSLPYEAGVGVAAIMEPDPSLTVYRFERLGGRSYSGQ